MNPTGNNVKILAVASFGGHWEQLCRIMQPIDCVEIVCATTRKLDADDGFSAVNHSVTNVSRRNWWKVPLVLWQMVRIISQEHPTHIVTTGAAPGLMALVAGRLMGVKSLWLDSIANVERMSTSGRMAKYFARAERMALQCSADACRVALNSTSDSSDQLPERKETAGKPAASLPADIHKIFITAGTQEPFDRLLEAVDLWLDNHKDCEVVAQAIPGRYRPRNFNCSEDIAPDEFARIFNDADVVVSHAGMGTILRSLQAGKSLVVMPRLKSKGEHRTNHQSASAGRVRPVQFIAEVNNEDELFHAMTKVGDLVAISTPLDVDFSAVTEAVERFVRDSKN